MKWRTGEPAPNILEAKQVFMGEFHHNIDEKGRIIIPARFREGLGDAFVVTKGLDQCLFVYPRHEWDVLTEKLRQLPFTRSETRAFTRFFFSGAAETGCDSQGRTVIPPNLREYAELLKEAVIIGVGNRIEIWSQPSWNDMRSDAEENYEELAEKLNELGAVF